MGVIGERAGPGSLGLDMDFTRDAHGKNMGFSRERHEKHMGNT